jgi:hypothetical protein
LVAAACPLLPADRVGAVFALSGVQAKEGKRSELLNEISVECSYEKGYEFNLSLIVSTAKVTGEPTMEEALKSALNGQAGERVGRLGDAAAFIVPQAGVGQLVVVKKLPSSQFRVVTITGDSNGKDKFITLAKDVMPHV